jgi:hypothetical protein
VESWDIGYTQLRYGQLEPGTKLLSATLGFPKQGKTSLPFARQAIAAADHWSDNLSQPNRAQA